VAGPAPSEPGSTKGPDAPAPGLGDLPVQRRQADRADAAITLKESRQRAVLASSGTEGPAGIIAVMTLYERSSAVRDYVLMRADGHCESCKLPAPFTASDGQPYLEAHHTTRLSDGGIDHPRHIAALCPTCHRRVHHGQGGIEINKLLVAWLGQTEVED